MDAKELREAWSLAWSVREDTHLGEYIGSIWNEICQDTFYLYRDAMEPGVYWYDTESNRKLNREFRERARRQ